jgi:hypothetical protein
MPWPTSQVTYRADCAHSFGKAVKPIAVKRLILQFRINPLGLLRCDGVVTLLNRLPSLPRPRGC